MKKIIALTSFLLLFSISQLFAVSISDDTVSGVDRYAVYIGCNYGGKSRERLLYAGSDAQSFKVTMSEIGGVTEANSRILFDPNKEAVDKALAEISKAISENSNNSKRSEFIFYYSGHSDENSLLLGDAKYDYSKLKAAITEVPSDIHVVILDSCYSGNFIRTKGGQKRKPFLIDDSSVVTGHAYLSSSSDNESSQESDEIESSYFTNAMITGLRGAADTSGDSKVTLNELYSYAFNDTLSKTESSKAGPQHPNYNITLVGSGDLILSDLTSAEAMLSLSKDAKGKFIIRDANDKLISEINKSAGQPIFMALPSGQYSALIIDEYSTKQGTFILEKDQIYVLDQNSLSSIKRKTNRLRGEKTKTTTEDDGEYLTLDDLEDIKSSKANGKNSSDSDYDDDLDSFYLDLDDLSEMDEEQASLQTEVDADENRERVSFDYNSTTPFSLQFVPGLYFVEGNSENTTFSLGIIGSKSKNIGAMQHSNIFSIATGNVFGIQSAGIFNIAKKQINAAQVAGVFNIGKDLAGAQVSGVFNIAEYVSGAQVTGVMNVARKVNGSQVAGTLNVAQSVSGAQVSGFFNSAQSVDGSQIGIVNVADSVSGITLGLFNYVTNGLHDYCIAFDSDDCVDMFYQGGSKALFTTFGFSRPRENYFEESYGSAYIGFGTEIQFPKTSLDLEFLWKFVYNSEIGKQLSEMDKKFSESELKEKIASLSIPCVKISWNFFETDFIRLFAACSLDFNITDWNDYAFSIYKKSWTIDTDDGKVSPTFSFGCKFKI